MNNSRQPPFENFEPNDLEALILSAGSYVRPSEELRPKVIEKARSERRENQLLHWLWQGALAIALTGVAFTNFRTFSSPLLDTADQRPSEVAAQDREGPHWHAVESLNAVRRRQASFFRWPL